MGTGTGTSTYYTYTGCGAVDFVTTKCSRHFPFLHFHPKEIEGIPSVIKNAK